MSLGSHGLNFRMDTYTTPVHYKWKSWRLDAFSQLRAPDIHEDNCIFFLGIMTLYFCSNLCLRPPAFMTITDNSWWCWLWTQMILSEHVCISKAQSVKLFLLNFVNPHENYHLFWYLESAIWKPQKTEYVRTAKLSRSSDSCVHY